MTETIDPASSALAQIRADHEAANAFGPNASDPVPRLLAAFEALLKDHLIVQLYEAADGCPHPEPQADTDEHDQWAGDHPHGTTGERICLLSPFDRACSMCSEMTYGDEPTTDDYVSAGGCHVRDTITRELTGEKG